MTQETTEVDEYIVFKIITPGGVTLRIQAEHMPDGWKVWNLPIEQIAEAASNQMGLPVTVERKQVCTSRPKE